MAISRKIQSTIEKSSWIRRMFETGARLKAEHGAENVFDFSLGNPNIAPPPEFTAALKRHSGNTAAGIHSYMPNSGYPDVREKVAEFISREYAQSVSSGDILMTVGAGGALNVVLKSILNNGDHIVSPSPCFMEYQFYCDNHGGILNLVPTGPDFIPDLDRIAEAISPRTAAVLINSPNNPTGVVYSQEFLNRMGEMLAARSRDVGRTVYLISDEPYRKIVYGETMPGSVFAAYPHSIVATSYSKDLSIPGERIGWLAIHPDAEDHDQLVSASILCNRILGYVNAPAIMQRVVGDLQGVTADIELYRRKRDAMCDILTDAGYEFIRPAGTFYLFPKAPGGDDLRVVQALQQERILTVPGRGFSQEGYFRLAFCVDDRTIEGAAEGLKKVAKSLK